MRLMDHVQERIQQYRLPRRDIELIKRYGTLVRNGYLFQAKDAIQLSRKAHWSLI